MATAQHASTKRCGCGWDGVGGREEQLSAPRQQRRNATGHALAPAATTRSEVVYKNSQPGGNMRRPPLQRQRPPPPPPPPPATFRAGSHSQGSRPRESQRCCRRVAGRGGCMVSRACSTRGVRGRVGGMWGGEKRRLTESPARVARSGVRTHEPGQAGMRQASSRTLARTAPLATPPAHHTMQRHTGTKRRQLSKAARHRGSICLRAVSSRDPIAVLSNRTAGPARARGGRGRAPPAAKQ